MKKINYVDYINFLNVKENMFMVKDIIDNISEMDVIASDIEYFEDKLIKILEIGEDRLYYKLIEDILEIKEEIANTNKENIGEL